MKLLLLCIPVLSRYWVPVSSLIPDLSTKILQTFSSRCAPMYTTTYPKTVARGITIQPRSDPSWPLPHVYTYSVRTTEFPILLLLYSKIFLMHRPHCSVFPDVLIISTGAFAKFGHEVTRNVISVRTVAPWPILLLVSRSSDQVISNLLHVVKVVFHTHTIIYVQSLCTYL
jgi:hypothetical protein